MNTPGYEHSHTAKGIAIRDRAPLLRVAFVVMFALTGVAPCGADEAPLVLGAQKRLFLDDLVIASKRNVIRRVHPARKFEGNPVIWRTEAWEAPLNIVYGSVIQDEGKYRIWYLSGPGVSYAESEDGITWVKPQLDFFPVGGQKTNILLRKESETSGSKELPFFQELFGVHKDPREPDPLRRYKMAFLSIDWHHTGERATPFHHGQRRGVGVAASPDGLRWRVIRDFATEAITDGATHWMFDPARERHVLYGRTKFEPPDVLAAWSGYFWFKHWYSGRAVARIESSDFVTWNFSDPLTAPMIMTADLQDAPGTEIYSMNVFPYEGSYIGLLQVFHSRPDSAAQPKDCTLDVQLAVSHDGIHFERVADRGTFLSVGGVGEWDRFNQSLANNPPIAVGDELRFYYGGRTYRHSPYRGLDTGPRAGGIGFATIPRDRFVSLEASFDGGEIITRPLKIGGGELHVNAKADFGEIQIDALPGELTAGATGTEATPLARSKVIRTDSLDTRVEWEEGELEQSDRPVRLRIRLANARLYALWCR